MAFVMLWIPAFAGMTNLKGTDYYETIDGRGRMKKEKQTLINQGLLMRFRLRYV